MSQLLRLQKAFKKAGITLHVEQPDPCSRIFTISNPHTDTTSQILLGTHTADDPFQLELKAAQQLLNFANVRRPDTTEKATCSSCATPDFHPGSIAPVGSVVATPLDTVIPHAIGTDINCGMRLLSTGLPWTSILPHVNSLKTALKNSLLLGQRHIPLSRTLWTQLLSTGPDAIFQHTLHGGVWDTIDQTRIQSEVAAAIGLQQLHKTPIHHLPDAYLPSSSNSPTFLDPAIGTIGSGNHFVELNIVDKIYDKQLAYQHKLKLGDVLIQIHSGSRDIGFHIGAQWMDRAKQAWTQSQPHLKHPESGLYALCGPLAEQYLEAMSAAARYAWFNRVILSEMTRTAFENITGLPESHLLVDIPHNIILQENGLNIHRKGSTPSLVNHLALIPGSMGDYSYLTHGTSNPLWLNSCSHGAGRTVRRIHTHHMPTPSAAQPQHLPFDCITLKSERIIEESPNAYKNIGPVINSQTAQNLIQPAIQLRPWITFKA